jgi:hypothetical protein
MGHSRNYRPYYGRASPIVWATTSTYATYTMGDENDPTHTMGELCQNSPIVWPKTPIVWVNIAYTMDEKFTPTMSKIPLLWVRFTSTMAQSTSTMAQYHPYYGPIDPYYGSIDPYYGSISPILWLNFTDTMAQFHSIHLYYGCLRPTSPSNPQAHAPSPGYTETKSAVPRKRISENNPTRETYKQSTSHYASRPRGITTVSKWHRSRCTCR